MYICIGKEEVLKITEIIGIFDIESIEKSQEYKSLYDKLNEKGKLIDISEGKPKSLIIYKNKEDEAGYISSILSSTLEKRCNESKII